MLEVEYYLEERLKEWAHWHAKQIDIGLGYPNRSLESRLQEEPTFFQSKKNHSAKIPYPHAAAEIERLVVELSHYQKLLADALRVAYIQPGVQATKAKSLGISVAQFKFCVKLAKAWLCGHISAVITLSNSI